MGGSGGSGAVLVCLLLLLDRLLLGFRMLIIEETGTQEVLQLCDVRGGWERRSTVVLPVRLGLGISGRGAAGAGARGWGEAAGGGGREAGLLQQVRGGCG